MKKRVYTGIAVLLIISAVFFTVPLATPAFSGTENIVNTEQTGRILPLTAEKAEISVSAASCVLIEADSGNILYSKNELNQAGMASTTKIMTALVVLNTLPTDMIFTIPKEAVGIEGSSIYLIEGEKLTIEQLLYGLLLESGNDCAVALALACSGSCDAFVNKMNETVAGMGITDTHFMNPHGLSNPNHYTSAYSLALITAKALKNETFKRIVSTKQYFIPRGGEQNKRCLTNHNSLLFSYNGMIGVKTGYTIATGRCLVTAASRDGITLIAVTLNDRNDWQSHKNMLDYGYSKYEMVLLAKEGSINITVPVTGGLSSFVNITNKEAASVVFLKGKSYTSRINSPHFLYAPVKNGDIVGYAEYYDSNGILFYRLPLIAAESIEIRKLTLFEKIFVY